MTRECTVRTYDIITFFSIKINRTVRSKTKSNLWYQNVRRYVRTYICFENYILIYVRTTLLQNIFFKK